MMTKARIEPTTIEIQTWKDHPTKPGYLTRDRRKTTREVIQEINAGLPEALKENMESEFSDMAELTSDVSGAVTFPEYRWIAVFPVTGANEGFYIHLETISDDEDGRGQTRKMIGSAKVWNKADAWEIARHVGDALDC